MVDFVCESVLKESAMSIIDVLFREITNGVFYKKFRSNTFWNSDNTGTTVIG